MTTHSYDIYIGVDPGKQGALAFLRKDGSVEYLRPTPLCITSDKRPLYDVGCIRAMVVCAVSGAPALATVERLHAMPFQKGGSIANYQRGVSEAWGWLFCALQIDCQYVLPQRWQKAILGEVNRGETKAAATLFVNDNWPGIDIRRTARSLKPHDGKADALCLAEYGRRMHERTE